MPGEVVAYRTRLNKKLFVLPCLFALPLFGACIWLLTNVTLYTNYAGPCFILAVLFMLHPYIRYISSEFAVTNKRVIIKVGFISRRTTETLLEKIATIEVDQSILGRIFDWGTISIIGTGGTKESFPNIASPLAFRLAVQEQTEAKMSK